MMDIIVSKMTAAYSGFDDLLLVMEGWDDIDDKDIMLDRFAMIREILDDLGQLEMFSGEFIDALAETVMAKMKAFAQRLLDDSEIVKCLTLAEILGVDWVEVLCLDVSELKKIGESLGFAEE